MLLNGCETFVADCHVRAAADLFRHSWDVVVLAALRAGPMRRAELLVAIGGVSDKVLSESLRRLTAARLVDRHRARGVATYALSELGASFADGPMIVLAEWASSHHDDLIGPHED